MISRLSFLLFCGIILAHLGDAQKLPKVKKLNMKAYINITGDTLVMKFHRPNENIKLEGFILGYGSNYFTNQYIQWPDNGKSYITDVDAETRYLIAVKPNDNHKKSCKDKNSVQKPLQLVVGTLTPTSVFLSWGILINPQVDWSALNKCPNDRFYTVRYREKNKDWHFQLCPTTETVIDNLKPNTMYEFGVKDNSEDEIWSKPQTHKTSPKGKENGNIENTYKIPKGTLQYASEDTKAFVPVTKVKQGFQNLSKSTPPPNGKSQAYRDEIKKPYVATTTTRIATPKPKLVSKITESPPVYKPSEKPPVDDPKPEPYKTEQDSSPKFNRTTESPTTSTVVKPVHSKRMPINLIALQIFEDPTVPSETQTSPPPIPKTTHSNKKLHSKPAPKSTQRVPINVISLQIFEEPDVPLVPNTQRPYQSTATQKPESPPHSEPVPTQKVSTPITKKPKPTPRTRAKPASTGAPMDTTKPKRPHVIVATTLAPYRLQHSSTRPKTSLRPRTRLPALNGATQGPIRSRPTGEFNWLPGTIPGGKVYDSTKLLGVSRNISLEPNNTGKRTFSVSSPPLPPVRPTSIRRRFHHSNVTGRPGVSVSSPPLLPVRPTAIRRKPSATNVTGRPRNQGGILIPRAPSTATPECAFACRKSPMKQPTLPSQEEDLVYSTVFSPSPKSDIDALGKPRYTAPHVVYMSKNESVPCSITDTLRHFPTEEESTNQEISSAPQNPPTNLTVVTVEGCSSFVVLNWEKPDNDTVTEYNVISKENGGVPGKDQSIITTNLTHSTVENLKPDTSYEFQVIPKNPLGEGPSSPTVEFNTESADPRVSEPVTGGKDAIWTEIKFKSDSYSDCRGKQFVKRTWYKKFVGIQLCNSLRYKIYLSDTLAGTFYNIGDQSGFGEDHCQFVDSFLEGRTGEQLRPNELNPKKGFYRSFRQQPVEFGDIGGQTHISYVHWYECGISIPGKW
ncbi:target of Nesh-SH3 isoform X7 [Bufo gargarizans]|uniref:target of Nesh-SH3 isoform X7 n=1 Tax=Bufo gargarizans TaxID=30331 RepID=UPI001CF48973|nr:target of Nesh-SH3 isoform X7 [Bufo gargarizans]